MPSTLDAFVVLLLIVVQVGLVAVAFFTMLAVHLRPVLRLPLAIALGVQWLVLVTFAFAIFGWIFGLASLVLSPVYALVARPVANRFARRWQGPRPRP